MDQDGDLVFRFRLLELGLGEDISFEVALDHRLEVLDYGRCRSRLHLRPLETSVCRRDEGEVVWEHPGGGTLVASENRLAEGYQLRGNIEDQMEIAKQGWILTYAQGCLTAITPPSSQEVACRANGNHICEFIGMRKSLLSVEWNLSGNPASLRTAERHYRFVEDEEGRLIEVVDENIGIAIGEFRYDENGLLISARCRGRPSIEVQWRKNDGFGRGNSFYKKPFSISRVNRVKYVYSRNGNRVSMKKCDSGKWDTLQWESLNGKIISIVTK